MARPEPVIAREPKTLADGIKLIDDVWEDMQRTFANGKARGTTTYFPVFDQNFTWKKGEITLLIGKPNSGKSEFAFQLMLMKAKFDGWKWGCYSPENFPADEFYDTLIHAYIGKTPDPLVRDYQMTTAQYKEGFEFIRKHFFYVYPDDHSPETINKTFEWLIEKRGLDGVLTDPFNQLETEYEGRDDLFLSRYLRDKKRFTVKHNLCDITTAHPKTLQRDKNGNFPVPEIYDIAGGAMWGNKMDNIMVIDRPNARTDPFDSTVDVIVKKIKKQKLVGIPGTCQFTFSRKTNRYYINNENPLEEKRVPRRLNEPKPDSEDYNRDDDFTA